MSKPRRLVMAKAVIKEYKYFKSSVEYQDICE